MKLNWREIKTKKGIIPQILEIWGGGGQGEFVGKGLIGMINVYSVLIISISYYTSLLALNEY